MKIISKKQNHQIYLRQNPENINLCQKSINFSSNDSRYRFACSARNFIDKWSKAGPSHHCAIGVGHWAVTLEKMAKLIGIPIIQV